MVVGIAAAVIILIIAWADEQRVQEARREARLWKRRYANTKLLNARLTREASKS